jgi:elongation factor Ts
VAISADNVKALREKTGAGVMDCKRALVDADGDMEKATELLRERGLANVAKRAGREAGQGLVEAYVHHTGKIGVLVEVNCETDFVANTPEFRQLARDIAQQVAATNPTAVDTDESGDGRTDDVPLLKQEFIRDPSRTIADLVRETAAKTNENIVVRRFTRYELGAAED